MTNIELIKELQKSVDKYGELPVKIDIEVLKNKMSIEDVRCNGVCVTIYDYYCQNMDREQAKYILPIIKAFSEGKTIQWRYIKGNTSLWWDDNNPTFEIGDFDYRIKPEPKYRPFNNARECMKEIKDKIKQLLIENKYYVGNSEVAKMLRELADELDDQLWKRKLKNSQKYSVLKCGLRQIATYNIGTF